MSDLTFRLGVNYLDKSVDFEADSVGVSPEGGLLVEYRNSISGKKARRFTAPGQWKDFDYIISEFDLVEQARRDSNGER